jgi:hypothetical protein
MTAGADTLRRRLERLESAQAAAVSTLSAADWEKLTARLHQLHDDLEHGDEAAQASAERRLIRVYRTAAESRERERPAGRLPALGPALGPAPEEWSMDHWLQNILDTCREREAVGEDVPQAIRPWQEYPGAQRGTA